MLSFIMHFTITNPMQAHYVFLIMYLFIYAICFPNEVLKLYNGSNIVFSSLGFSWSPALG